MPNNPILCVDDDPINLSLLRSTLQEDYKLVFARSGSEALTAVLKHSPSLILLDVQMPDITGFEVAQQLKSNPKTEHIPIIFITSLLDVDDEKAGFDVGGVDYITKPLSPPIVRARVHTHLSLVRASKLDASYRDAIYMIGEAGHYNDKRVCTFGEWQHTVILWHWLRAGTMTRQICWKWQHRCTTQARLAYPMQFYKSPIN
jgi:putative two-component system response regulator